MPIVISYEDAAALGNAAYQSGYYPGLAAGQGQAFARQDADAARQQQFQLAQDQMAQQSIRDAQDRVLRQTLAKQAIDAQLAHAGIIQQGQDTRAQQALAGRLQLLNTEADFRNQREQQAQQDMLDRIRLRAQTTGRNGTLTPDGTPDNTQAIQELRAAGHLIPYPTKGVAPEDAPFITDQSNKDALTLAKLPTNQIETLLSNKPSSPWAPYLRAILGHRRALLGGGSGAPASAAPAAAAPSLGGGSAGLAGSKGLGDLRGVPTDQLLRMLGG